MSHRVCHRMWRTTDIAIHPRLFILSRFSREVIYRAAPRQKRGFLARLLPLPRVPKLSQERLERPIRRDFRALPDAVRSPILPWPPFAGGLAPRRAAESAFHCPVVSGARPPGRGGGGFHLGLFRVAG